MINLSNVKKYCSEDPSLIENYDKAINDKFHTWVCHHRLEIQDDKVLLSRELKKQDLYYNRPASELIFLTSYDHYQLHMKYSELFRNVIERYKSVKEAKKSETTFESFFYPDGIENHRERIYEREYELVIYNVDLIRNGKIKEVPDINLCLVAVLLELIDEDKYKEIMEKAKTRPFSNPIPNKVLNDLINKVNNVSINELDELKLVLLNSLKVQKIKADEERERNKSKLNFFQKFLK